MAKFSLRHGSTADTLTREELREELDTAVKQWWQEASRGSTTARFSASAAVASTAVTLPATGAERLGPDIGFAWAVQRITAYGLSTNDVLSVYRNSSIDSNFIGIITPTSPFHIGKLGLILRGDEQIIVTGTSLTATGTITINGDALQTAELDIYKEFW